VRVPSMTVYSSSTALGKTSRLYILDVKPRSKAANVGPRLLTAYGLDKVELTLPEELKLNMLRERFEERPGRLSNASLAQPEAPAQLVVGRDNRLRMPKVVARSIKGGSDLYFMRSDSFAGELIFGETDESLMKKGRTTSTPKPKGPPAAGRRPEADRRATAGPSGSGDRRRRDSSPAMSLAASGSLGSPLGRAASGTPVRDDGGEKGSGSGGQKLFFAKKSKPGEAGPSGVAQSGGAAKSRAASPAGVARTSGASKSSAAGLEDVLGDTSDGSYATASPRRRSRGSRASSRSAASPVERARSGRASVHSATGSVERERGSRASVHSAASSVERARRSRASVHSAASSVERARSSRASVHSAASSVE
jgi:hypothetical protein